ncbi:helix-turn-helix domain-containing protein [Spelaeicoccus albus]|uniref:PucR-like helix-turn-helix protein n=1 Tax=Spelaeicoccus albus TaxID=1280376 RepID=A0A7Z0AB12_9MICO|nr:helix-turn-helix domain-containing protein [Spelaeicoccus albus]NYI66825.1 hypothetical protein [Spelaeicoccus albus]
MDNREELRARTRPRWSELVRLLRGDVDGMLETFVAALARNKPYASGLVPEADIRRSGIESFSMLLEALLADDIGAVFADVPGELGRRRARQGVPAENLVSAVREDFHVIWSTILQRAGTDDMATLALHVDQLWRVVDEYARQVQYSYLTERAVMAREERSLQERYVATLFGQEGRLPEQLRQIGLSLRVDVDGRFRVYAADGPDADELRRIVRESADAGRACYVHDEGMTAIAFWQVGSKTAPPSGLEAVTCVEINDVDGLAAVPVAATTASGLVSILRPEDDGPQSLRALWPRAAAHRLDAVAIDHLRAETVGKLATCTPHERSRVVETVQAYLQTGTVAAAAARAYCHRNTVLARLHRFAELTGIDVTVPTEAALAVVLLSDGSPS